MVNENTFSGIDIPTRIVFRSNRNCNDRIGMGIQNKPEPGDRITTPTSFSFFSVSWLAITNSTISKESAPKSSINEASIVTDVSVTPNCSTIIPFTFSNISSELIFSSSPPLKF